MKRHILNALREQFDAWEELLAGMSEEQVTTPLLPSKWSCKDNIAHLRAWQKRSIARMEAAVSNREPEYPRWPLELNPNLAQNTDQINGWIYETHRNQPWSEVHSNWKVGFLRLLGVGEKISERNLLDSGKYPWMNEQPLAFIFLSSYDHHQEHYENLTAWMKEHKV